MTEISLHFADSFTAQFVSNYTRFLGASRTVRQAQPAENRRFRETALRPQA